MRIHRLELEGIGPFPGRHAIDLDALSAEGMFLLRGETGSGKSSVLSAILFALYGATKADHPHIVSEYKDPFTKPEAVIEFSVGAQRFRITRSPKWIRPKQRSTGTTTENPRTHLSVMQEGGWVSLTTTAAEVGSEVERLLGLSRRQFLQTMMLRQGEFAEFLQASDKERFELLEKLFDITEFSALEKHVAARADAAKKHMQRTLDRIGSAEDEIGRSESHGQDLLGADAFALPEAPHGDQDSDGAVLDSAAALEDPVQDDDAPEAAAQDDVSGERFGPDHLERLTRVSETALERARAEVLRLRKDQEALDVEQKAVQAGAARVDLAMELIDTETARRAQLPEAQQASAQLAADERAAEPVRLAELAAQARAAAERAAAQASSAEESLAEAAASERLVWLELPETPAGARAEFSAACAEAARTGQITVSGVVGQQEKITELTAAAQTAATGHTAAQTAQQRAAAAAESAAQKAEAAEQIAAQAAEKPQDTAAAEAGLAQAEATLAIVHQRGVAETAHAAAETAVAEALAAERAASAGVDRLWALFGAEAGPRLAEHLVSGEPCVVCGSCEHPNPATGEHDGELVTLEQIDAAKARYDAAQAARQAAQGKAAITSAALTEARALAGDATAQQAQAAVVAAAAEIAQRRANAENAAQAQNAAAAAQQTAQTAQQALIRAEQKLALAQERSSTAAAQAEKAQTEARAALERIGLTEAEIAGSGADLSQTLSGIVQALTALEQAANRVGPALEARADQQHRAQRAEAETASALERSGFATVEEAAAAKASAAQVAAWHEALATQRSLRERILAGLERLRADSAPGAGTPGDERSADSGAELLSLLTPNADPGSDEDLASAEQLVDCAQADALAQTRTELAAEQERLAAQQANAAASTEAGIVRQTEIGSWAVLLSGAVERLTRAREEAGAELVEVTRLQNLANALTANDTAQNPARITLATYVLSERLKEIAAAANERLVPMSGDRYRLVYEASSASQGKAGLGLAIVDAWSGSRRPTASMSGGEKFMASLSLALGLADTVQQESGGLRIDTLFIDEGFGTLDAGTLELVMTQLDGLRAGGRAVGLVSHVSELHERIPRQIYVEKSPQGSTVKVLACEFTPRLRRADL